MARQDKKTYDLSEAEQRDLFNLIQQGKALPEKYRFVLFEDKREVELVWNGKTRDVCTTVLPFQTLEHIDEPRKETKTQGDLFDSRGRQTKGWSNKLIWGDNKLILSSLKAGPLRQQIEDAGGLKLIYIDPPFDVGADFSMDIEIGGETFHKEPTLIEQIAYRDTWGRGTDSFISMLYERLILMRDLLTKHWTDWVDYWAVDFDYLQRKEIIKVPVGTGIGGVASLEGFEQPQGELQLPEFEERWTGGYIFENEWQSFRTRQSRDLELTTAVHTYDRPGRYTVAVKVIDIFGNDTMTLVPVNVG